MNESNKTILIIGGSGYYGSALAKSLGLSNVVKTYYKKAIQDGIFFNLVSSKVSDILLKQPNIKKVIISAGIINFSVINNNPEKADFYNVTCIKKIINELKELNLIPIFISSESVFNGKKGNYNETDKTSPTFKYGLQKDLIEKYIIKNFNVFQILRLSKIFDSNPNSNTLIMNWIKKLNLNENIYCANDNIFSPIHLNEVCEISKRIIINSNTGIYHICSLTGWNRKEMLRKVLDNYSEYNTYSGKLFYQSLNKFPGAKNQPLNTSMDPTKAIIETHFQPKSFDTWVKVIVKQSFNRKLGC